MYEVQIPDRLNSAIAAFPHELNYLHEVFGAVTVERDLLIESLERAKDRHG